MITSRCKLLIAVFFVAGALTGWGLRSLPFDLWKRPFARNAIPVWNWCPRDVASVVAFPSEKKFEDPADLRVLCAARLEEEVTAPQTGSFSVLYKATGRTGQISFVERHSESDVFRVDGKTFRSRQFEGNTDQFR